MKNVFIVLAIFLVITGAKGQDKLLTLEDAVLKQRTTLAPKRLTQLNWIPNTSKYYYVENRDNAETLIEGMADREGQSPICTLAELNTAMRANGADTLTKFPVITFTSETKFEFELKKMKYGYDFATKLIQIVEENNLPEKAENIDRSTTGKIAYTLQNNLYVQDGTNQITLTIDNDGVVNGQSVHRNEFGINKGTFWSPNGKYLAYYRMDENMVTQYPLLDFKQRPAATSMIRYPMAGDASHHVSVVVYDPIEGGKVTLQTGEPKDQYLTNIAWSPDEKYIYIAVLNRDQNHMMLQCYNAKDGAFIKTLFEEADTKYVEPLNPVMFVKGNPEQFIWQSARSRYKHLYLYNTQGVLVKQLTSGTWEVTDVIGFSPRGEKLFFMATIESPVTRHLCCVELATGKMTQLTQTGGIHTVQMSSDAKYFIDNFQSISVPRVISIINDKGENKQTLLTADNPLQEYALGEMKLFTLNATDGTSLYCRMYLPPGLSTERLAKLPSIVYVYGGPHAQMINDTWNGGGDLWFRYMAQQGYVIFTLDNRGSDNRGLDFEQATFRNLGKIEIDDQLRGVEYLKTLPYIDPARIGVFGWSYGGFMATSLMTKHPGVFKAAVAGGPVIDWKYYEVMYTERYMDTPEQNKEGYEEADLTKQAKHLAGKLMLIHGTNDDVVVWQHSLNFLKACIDAGKQVDYMVYPGHLHNVTGKDRAHLFRKITDYFDTYLK